MNITMIVILCTVLGFLLGVAVGASMILTAWEKTCDGTRIKKGTVK